MLTIWVEVEVEVVHSLRLVSSYAVTEVVMHCLTSLRDECRRHLLILYDLVGIKW